MGGKLHFLPPAKRFMLMQQQEDDNNISTEVNPPTNNSTVSFSQLPAKKRKFSPEKPLPFSNNTTTTTTTICLPAKKRVWAFHPFDLNVEYNETNDQNLSQQDTKNNEEEEDGIVCAICDSTDGDPTDPIVLCDGCDLMVHTSCYGHPLTNGIPEGDWFCAKCLVTKTNSTNQQPLTCCLCPITTGALKPTTNNGKWAHVICALLVPEVFFVDSEGREGIDYSKVPSKRWERECYICETKNGCGIDCSEPKCSLSFHVTCGLKHELCIEYKEARNKGAVVAGFCSSHTALWKKQQQTGKFKIVPRDEHDR